MEALLDDPGQREAFRDFLVGNYAEEMLDFLVTAREASSLTAIEGVWRTYLAPDAERACNVSFALVKELEAEMTAGDEVRAKAALDQVALDVALALRIDKWNAFLSSSFFALMEQRKTAQRTVLDAGLWNTFVRFCKADAEWTLVEERDGLRAWRFGNWVPGRYHMQKERLAFPKHSAAEVASVVFEDYHHQPRYLGKVCVRGELLDQPSDDFKVVRLWFRHGTDEHVVCNGVVRHALDEGKWCVLRKSVQWQLDEQQADQGTDPSKDLIHSEVMAGGYLIEPMADGGCLVTRMMQLRLGKEVSTKSLKALMSRALDLLPALRNYMDEGRHEK